MALRGGLPMFDEGTIPCKQAQEALTFAFVGLLFILCFGFVLGLFAIYRAFQAKRMIELNPRLSGWGKANAAIIVGTIVTVLNILCFLAGVSAANRR
jgi:hypothetical protein